MTLIPITQILVPPNRQRREFKEAELQDLVTSIRDSEFGLMHALVLRRTPEGHVLVAGERRLRAIQDIYDLGGHFRWNGAPVGASLVPYVDLGDLPPLAAMEAELEENIRRVDLTWQERADATARYLAFKRAEADEAEVPKHDSAIVTEAAHEIRPDTDPKTALDAARKEAIVARHLTDPDVKAAKTLQEAYKILKKKEGVRENQALAAAIGPSFTSKAHTLVHTDSKRWMWEYYGPLFDIICTDPPYGMGADEFGDSGQGVAAEAHFYKDDYETWCSIMEWFPEYSLKVTKPDAHLYAFCDIDRFEEFKEIMTDAGWRVHRTPLVWSNPSGFRAPWPQQGPQRRYELILYAVKGAKPVNSVRGDVLEYRRDENLGHPAQKPVNLLIDLLARSSKPGQTVLDPFAGSGATIAAGHELTLAVTALEKDAAAYGVAVRRLGQLGESS